MENTNLTERRTGALWVAGTGAFLLLAAAAVFIAVRWDQIPDSGKLAIVGALTGAFLAAGRGVRRTLPATGDVLFHLGAFLLPIDLAAVNLRVEAGWRGLLLSEGLLGTFLLGGLGATTGSKVLKWAGTAGGITLAAGVAAVSPVPGPIVLAALGAVAFVLRDETRAVAWVSVAGLAPVLSSVASSVTRGAGVLAELGFAGHQRVGSAVSAIVAAVVLGLVAQRRRDLTFAVVGALSLVIGVADGWIATNPSHDRNLVAAGALFLVLELVALAVRRDPFWSRPARWPAVAAEVCGGLATVTVMGLAAIAPVFDDRRAGPAAALALGAAAWTVAAVRRPRTSDLTGPLALPAVLYGVTSVEAASASPIATAFAFVGGAALLAVAAEVTTPAPLVLLGSAAMALWAPVVSWDHPLIAGVTGVAGGLVVLVAATRRDSVAASAAAIVPVFVGLAIAGSLPTPAWASTSAVATLWAFAAVADALRAGRVARVPRWALGLPVLAAAAGDPANAIAVAALATLACVVESLRTDDPRVAYAAAVSSQFLVVFVARAAGLTSGEPGVALCVGAVVWAGFAALVEDERWLQPLLVAAFLGTVLGVLGASNDGRSLATATMIAGGLVLAAGVAARIPVVAHLGGVLATVGLAGHLVLSGVAASEPYVAPVALQLVAVGWFARRRDDSVSSWVAYTPALLLLGGAALAERLAGGAGWHAVVAGAVGLVAVAAGGWDRLAGPLFTGTALLVAVTVNESLAMVAGVPTWAWLAAGGSLLLSAGVAMERKDTTPVEAGRRVVDLIQERFD